MKLANAGSFRILLMIAFKPSDLPEFGQVYRDRFAFREVFAFPRGFFFVVIMGIFGAIEWPGSREDKLNLDFPRAQRRGTMRAKIARKRWSDWML